MALYTAKKFSKKAWAAIFADVVAITYHVSYEGSRQGNLAVACRRVLHSNGGTSAFVLFKGPESCERQAWAALEAAKAADAAEFPDRAKTMSEFDAMQAQAHAVWQAEQDRVAAVGQAERDARRAAVQQ